jgi:hypothetical protein
MDMMGAFYCPHCGTANACNCKTCTPYIKEGEFVNKWTEDGEAMICANCDKVYSPDQSLEEEMRQRNFPLQGGMDAGNQVDAPQN